MPTAGGQVIAGMAPIGQLAPRRGASLVASGTVKWFNEENGYGYIVPDAGGKDLFVHRGSILGDWRTRTLPEGTRVGFELREGGMSPEAVNVLAFATKGSP
jgi:cold shock protein